MAYVDLTICGIGLGFNVVASRNKIATIVAVLCSGPYSDNVWCQKKKNISKIYTHVHTRDVGRGGNTLCRCGK